MARLLRPDGEAVAKFSGEKGWTQEDLAYKAGYAVGTIANVEAGKSCRIKTLSNIAQALEVDLAQLIARPPPSSPGQPSPPTIPVGKIQDLKNLVDDIYDHTRLLYEKTYNFVGRQFVLKEIDRFLEDRERGYFFLLGDPGIGKSAVAACLVADRGYVHHFNIAAEGINTPETFLRSVCAQLIITYGLPYTSIPATATQDATFLKRLLEEVSKKLTEGEKAVIVVDALDEADHRARVTGANVLYLPMTLPDGVYIIATTRRERLDREAVTQEAPLRLDCEYESFHIDNDSPDNNEDVKQYLHDQITKAPNIVIYIKRHQDNEGSFVRKMCEKSEGNFMYLHYVLPEIADGAYTHVGLDAIPVGLKNYYEDHWRRMQGQDKEGWFKYKLPIIVVLAVAKKAISVDLLRKFSEVTEPGRVVSALEDWAQFIHEEIAPYQGGFQKRYSLYHTSFYDFLAEKDQIKESGVDLKKVARAIARKFLEPTP